MLARHAGQPLVALTVKLVGGRSPPPPCALAPMGLVPVVEARYRTDHPDPVRL